MRTTERNIKKKPPPYSYGKSSCNPRCLCAWQINKIKTKLINQINLFVCVARCCCIESIILQGKNKMKKMPPRRRTFNKCGHHKLHLRELYLLVLVLMCY